MSRNYFYGLLKIHKSTLISEPNAKKYKEYVEVLEPSDLKLRPIVAGPTCPTRPLRDLLDKILNAFVFHVKSYVRNNRFFGALL